MLEFQLTRKSPEEGKREGGWESGGGGGEELSRCEEGREGGREGGKGLTSIDQP
jgi:hypothetical protein